MKIVNNTDLPYKVIGQIIDDTILKTNADTIYYGKVYYFEVESIYKKYKVQITYFKRYVEWRFEEYDKCSK